MTRTSTLQLTRLEKNSTSANSPGPTPKIGVFTVRNRLKRREPLCFKMRRCVQGSRPGWGDRTLLPRRDKARKNIGPESVFGAKKKRGKVSYGEHGQRTANGKKGKRKGKTSVGRRRMGVYLPRDDERRGKDELLGARRMGGGEQTGVDFRQDMEGHTRRTREG